IYSECFFIQIIILSLIFSWSLIKSRSIIVPIALHTFWDLLCWLL
ncbi:MAG: CPBP family intramembrane metalloprotease, partial [Ruminococcus sp.]|nr:CPBP family intramembrane metalloprotease [Ruminococcus sp.]